MSNIEREQTQVYRVTMEVDVKVYGGNDKGRRKAVDDYVSCLICHPLFEGDPAETFGIGWDDEGPKSDTEHAPYQFHDGLKYFIKSIRKSGPVIYEVNNHFISNGDQE